MKETTLAFITFFLTIFLLIQMKLIGRLRKLRKNKGITSGKGYYLESFDAVCVACEACGNICECFGAAGGISEGASERKEEKRKKRAKKTEESRLMELVRSKEKASVWWLSYTVGVTRERVREIIAKDPNFKIENENENVYNKELMSKEERRICPACENPIELGSDYCSRCGTNIE